MDKENGTCSSFSFKIIPQLSNQLIRQSINHQLHQLLNRLSSPTLQYFQQSPPKTTSPVPRGDRNEPRCKIAVFYYRNCDVAVALKGRHLGMPIVHPTPTTQPYFPGNNHQNTENTCKWLLIHFIFSPQAFLLPNCHVHSFSDVAELWIWGVIIVIRSLKPAWQQLL